MTDQADVYVVYRGGDTVLQTEQFADVASYVAAAGGADTFAPYTPVDWKATDSNGDQIHVHKYGKMGAD